MLKPVPTLTLNDHQPKPALIERIEHALFIDRDMKAAFRLALEGDDDEWRASCRYVIGHDAIHPEHDLAHHAWHARHSVARIAKIPARRLDVDEFADWVISVDRAATDARRAAVATVLAGRQRDGELPYGVLRVDARRGQP